MQLVTPNKRLLLVSLGILILLTGLTYINRFPTGDDGWFAEQSYWLQKQGVVRSEFFRGILGWENQILVSHKLFLFFGAGLIKIFGFGLPTVQFVGFIFFVIIILELISYIRQTAKENYIYFSLLLLILLFSNRVLVRLSFENRPELMVAALGFGSFLCINFQKDRLLRTVWAGLLAGLAMLCHLNGVIFLLAGVGTYLYFRQYKEAVIFSIIGGLTGLLYFIDVVQVENGFSIWYHQFRHDPATQEAFGWYSKLIVLLTFPRLFFESPEQAALSILFVFILWHQRRLIKQVKPVLFIYSVILVSSFWIITKHGSGSYMPLFMPFMFIISYELYKVRPFNNWGLKLVLLAYFIIGLFGIVELIYKNYTLGSFPNAYKNLRSHIPKQSTGLVPLTFFFNEYEQHKRLVCHENFAHYSQNFTNDRTGQKALPFWANQHGIDFILLDYQYRREPYYPDSGSTDLPLYRLTYFDGRFAIYTKK